jgi:tRNA threonylcarbamoyladenosine biosynthesis protein TsaB
MTRILALDTSTEACSCALNLDGDIREDYAVIPRQHAQRILPMIRDLMQASGVGFADLDAIAWGRGPGSFTGLRIAAGVTQGLALAAGLPVVPVSTLAALALQHHEAHGSSAVFACLDARIDELYWGCYRVRLGLPELVGDEQLTAPEDLPGEFLRLNSNDGRLAAVGNGLVYRERMPEPVRNLLVQEDPGQLPHAGALARLAALAYERGDTVTAEATQPLYLRDKVTHS